MLFIIFHNVISAENVMQLEAYAVSPDFSFLIWNTKLNIDHAYYDHF